MALGSGVDEEDFGVGYAGELGDPFGQLDLGFDEIEGGGVEHPLGLRLDGVHHLGDGMTNHADQDPPEEVEVPVPFGIDHMPP